jgi:GntR family transcriptional regulator, transcriptional repressor for pyruvate dehydrogenase complex
VTASAAPASPVSEEIAGELRRQILGGKYVPGDRLPSERDLSARYGTHRSSVREALKKLEQQGLIQIRPGGGARVQPLEEAGLGVLPHLMAASEPPSRELVAQWLDVWELVVAGAARLAVERGTPDEFDEALRLLSRLRARSLAPAAFIETGDALTHLVARASRNLVLRMVRNGLMAQLRARSEVRLQTVPARRAFAPILRELEEAVRARDPGRTEEAVRRLIRENRGLVLDLVAGPSDGN